LHDHLARQAAKPVNFGCLYGGGSERLRITARTQFGVEFSQDEAKDYHRLFFDTYPGLRIWHQAARDASFELTYGATAYDRLTTRRMNATGIVSN
jgi:DNA polymerase I-like protein with 3'-5' exonuclease and polymerase domains